MLEVVHTASFGELDVDAALDKRAAENIVAHRDGADALLGTADDDPFETLGELDAVPQVGPAAITKLVLYAESLGLLDDDELSPADVAAILAVIDQRPPSQWWENMDLRRCNLEPFDGLNETAFYRWDYFTELGNGFTEHFGVPPTGGGCP